MVDGGCLATRNASPCPDKPLSARLTVLRPGSRTTVASAISDADGHFRIPLAAGRYTLHPANLTGSPVPAAVPVDVEVQPHRYTTVDVSFDSGVR
jgi:hypothetical protein